MDLRRDFGKAHLHGPHGSRHGLRTSLASPVHWPSSVRTRATGSDDNAVSKWLSDVADSHKRLGEDLLTRFRLSPEPTAAMPKPDPTLTPTPASFSSSESSPATLSPSPARSPGSSRPPSPWNVIKSQEGSPDRGPPTISSHPLIHSAQSQPAFCILPPSSHAPQASHEAPGVRLGSRHLLSGSDDEGFDFDATSDDELAMAGAFQTAVPGGGPVAPHSGLEAQDAADYELRLAAAEAREARSAQHRGRINAGQSSDDEDAVGVDYTPAIQMHTEQALRATRQRKALRARAAKKFGPTLDVVEPLGRSSVPPPDIAERVTAPAAVSVGASAATTGVVDQVCLQQPEKAPPVDSAQAAAVASAVVSAHVPAASSGAEAESDSDSEAEPLVLAARLLAGSPGVEEDDPETVAAALTEAQAVASRFMGIPLEPLGPDALRLAVACIRHMEREESYLAKSKQLADLINEIDPKSVLQPEIYQSSSSASSLDELSDADISSSPPPPTVWSRQALSHTSGVSQGAAGAAGSDAAGSGADSAGAPAVVGNIMPLGGRSGRRRVLTREDEELCHVFGVRAQSVEASFDEEVTEGLVQWMRAQSVPPGSSNGKVTHG